LEAIAKIPDGMMIFLVKSVCLLLAGVYKIIFGFFKQSPLHSQKKD